MAPLPAIPRTATDLPAPAPRYCTLSSYSERNMPEQQELQSLGVTGEWLWGDDAETVVFAQAFGVGKTLIFRFSLDPQNTTSLASRIVNCYHDLDVANTQASFDGRPAMRQAVWTGIASIWPDCVKLAAADAPDTIIDIMDDMLWKSVQEPLFRDYLSILPNLKELQDHHPGKGTVAFQDLTREQQLGGRGSTTLVYRSAKPEQKWVFKGIDFRTYLHGYESGHADEEVKTFLRSFRLLEGMPSHPNILAAPELLVTLPNSSADIMVVCGSLYPFYLNGSLADQIDKSNLAAARIPLPAKAKWCHQMTEALLHTHYVANTYHMDIKPGNFILNDDQNLILIDWEQTDAPVTTVAPELDGTWDAEEIRQGPSGDSASIIVKYTKYNGQERRNMPENTPGDNGWNVWNSLLEWQRSCPRASELAEVFSLGRTMWILLRQCGSEDFENVESTEDIKEDWGDCDDIPTTWKEMVQRCLQRDPQRRPLLQECRAFWALESGRLTATENIKRSRE